MRMTSHLAIDWIVLALSNANLPFLRTGIRAQSFPCLRVRHLLSRSSSSRAKHNTSIKLNLTQTHATQATVISCFFCDCPL